jgi:DNA topoisomerase-3
VIAEKPSVAGDIAKALGKFERHADYYEGEKYIVSSAVGHLLELAPPDGFEPARGKWKIENLPSLPEDFSLVPIEKNAGRLATLKKLLKKKEVGDVINACDAGREGELIFRNVIRSVGSQKPIKRLWLQSMTTESIRSAFANLRSDEEMRPLADAAVSRSESDWLVGINATRALTAFNSQGGGFQKTTSGRVQTPTLAILAEREERIRKFTPRTYFEVCAEFGVTAGTYRGTWFDPAFKKNADEDGRAERLWDRARADEIKAKCEGRTGTIEEEKKPSSQTPPLLFDLTSLQRAANQSFGFPAKMTLQIAQALYEKHKVLTYPRTDSKFLPEDHVATAKQVLGAFADNNLARHARKALDQGWVYPNKRIFNNAKVSDHFAIVPTGTQPKALSDTEQRIFDMVAKRFIAIFYPAAQFELTTRITTVEGEKFKTNGKVIVDPGYLAVYGKTAVVDEEDEKTLVAVAAGESARTEAIEVKESETKPPPRFNEATLLSAMEGAGKLIDDEELREAMSERGLGTPATRAQIIEGLLFEGYLLRQGKELIVTQKGLSLITLLRDLDAGALTKPELTGEWEFKLKEMEKGRLSRADFMDQIRGLTREIVEKVRNGMGKEVRGEYQALEVSCPRCQNPGPFRETFRTFECPNPECKLTIWKTMAGRELERDEVAKLLKDGRVGPLEGFRSKMGRAFNAVVVLNAEGKQSFDFESDKAAEGEPQTPVDPQPLGTCPVCKEGQVYEYATAFMCEKTPLKQCNFRTGKLILQRQIARDQVQKLVVSGKTGLITRFISKKGRPFSAFLVLGKAGKVEFEFEKREPKAKGAKSAKSKAVAPAEAKPEEPAPVTVGGQQVNDGDIPF